jgi:hypothetical protein
LILQFIKTGIIKTVNILTSQFSVSLSLFYCRFIKILIKAHRSVQLPGKQISKLLGLVFLEIKNYINSNSRIIETEDCEHFSLIFKCIEKDTPNLEVCLILLVYS